MNKLSSAYSYIIYEWIFYIYIKNIAVMNKLSLPYSYHSPCEKAGASLLLNVNILWYQSPKFSSSIDYKVYYI